MLTDRPYNLQGSTYVYVTYINPFLLRHEAEIDKTIEQSKGQAKAAGLDYMRRAYVYIREALMRAILVSCHCKQRLHRKYAEESFFLLLPTVLRRTSCCVQYR